MENEKKILTPEAKRALAEAAERREKKALQEQTQEQTLELLGRGGLDPARYKDWEVKGLAIDF
jgi:hypothetical protein